MLGKCSATEQKKSIILSLRSGSKITCNEKIFRTADLIFVHYLRKAAFKVLLWNIGVVKWKQFGERKLMQ